MSLVFAPAANVGAAPSCPENGPQTLLDIAQNNPTGQLKTLEALVEAAGFGAGLAAEGPIDVFLPVDTAFDVLLTSYGVTADVLLQRTDLIKRLLQYHVVTEGAVCNGNLEGKVATALTGESFTVSDDGNTITDGTGNVINVIASVPASNGVGYVIDGVLLPIPEPPSPAAESPATEGTAQVPSDAQLTVLFNRADTNGDGLLKIDELQAAAAFIGVELTDEQIQRILELAPDGFDLETFLQSASTVVAGGFLGTQA